MICQRHCMLKLLTGLDLPEAVYEESALKLKKM